MYSRYLGCLRSGRYDIPPGDLPVIKDTPGGGGAEGNLHERELLESLQEKGSFQILGMGRPVGGGS
jgi:hypothetical protein